MRIGRLVLVVTTLVAILIFPVLIRDALQSLQLPNAYAASPEKDAAGRVYQSGNNNDNNGNNNDNGSNNGDDDDDNDNSSNDESDNEGEDNENEVTCYENLNDNADEVPCDFNTNDNAYVPPAAAPAPAPAPGTAYIAPSRRCFGVQEIGNVQLDLDGGTITVQVVPAGGFSEATWLELDDVADMNSVPAAPGGATFLDHLVWNLNAGTGCDGAGIGTLPGAVNLGIPYHVSADKSKLQIVILKNGAWQEVTTVPDPNPNNPYISSTIREAGTYAVIQKP